MSLHRYIVRLLSIAFCFSLSFSAVSAKENKDLMRANYYYAHYAYFEAIPYFEKISAEMNDPVIYSKLADCYTVVSDLQKAAECYAKAVDMPGCNEAVKLRYAQLLMQLKKYDDAEKWLKVYQEKNQKDERVANLILGCQRNRTEEKTLPDGVVQLLNFNTNGSEFAPSLWNGKLVFSSDTDVDIKKKTDGGTGRSFYNIYALKCVSGHCDTGFTKLTGTKQLNNKYHDGPCTFSADGKVMYFTRSRVKDGLISKRSLSNKDSTVLLEIMVASDYDTATKKFKTVVPFEYNSKEYAVAHPTVSPDGSKLVFTSNMPKGMGGSDLYLCSKAGGNWSAPKNMGTTINTEGEEVFPYWADDTTLYFSSDGHPGMGGLDIYKCTWMSTSNSFTTPENIGAPINSSYDDISLALYSDGGSTYFSSNRPASIGGDNIYYYKKERIFLQLNVYDSLTRQPIPEAKIEMHWDAQNDIASADAGGRYFTRLYPERRYDISLGKDNYNTSHLNVVATSQLETDTIVRNVYLYQPPGRVPDKIVGLDPGPLVKKVINIMDTPGVRTFEINKIYEVGHLYYDFNKADLKPEHKPYLDTILAQMRRNPTMRILLRAHTDCRGSVELNKDLSNRRALAVVDFLVKNGIERSRLEYIGLGFTEPTIQCPVCDQCTEEQHYLNRLLDFKVLHL